MARCMVKNYCNKFNQNFNYFLMNRLFWREKQITKVWTERTIHHSKRTESSISTLYVYYLLPKQLPVCPWYSLQAYNVRNSWVLSIHYKRLVWTLKHAGTVTTMVMRRLSSLSTLCAGRQSTVILKRYNRNCRNILIFALLSLFFIQRLPVLIVALSAHQVPSGLAGEFFISLKKQFSYQHLIARFTTLPP